MTKKHIIIVIGCCLVFSAGITLLDYRENQRELNQKRSTYSQGNTTVKKVYPPRITKYGSKQSAYDLVVALPDGTTIELYRKELSASLKEADQIVILYNPKDFQEQVYLK